MALTTVYSALADAISGGTIDLWTSTARPALSALRPVLGLFGIGSAYSLDGATVGQGLDTVTLGGDGKFGQPGDPRGQVFNVRATLRYTEDSTGQGSFALALAFTDAGWTFSGFFNPAVLPPSQWMREAGKAVVWGASFLNGLRLDSPVFSADSQPHALLRLSGFLADAPLFGPYRDFIRPWPLSLAGTLTMPRDWTTQLDMTLAASAGGSSALAVGRQEGLDDGPAPLQLRDLGFELLARNDLSDEDWGRKAFSVLNLVGTVTVGGEQDGLRARLSTQVLTSSVLWHMTATFDREHASVVRGLAQLGTIFGLPALPLPDHFPLIDTFKFRSIELYFSSPIYRRAPGAFAPPVLQSLALTIGSDNVFEPPIPFLKIHELGTRWVWSWTKVYVDDGSDAMRTVSSVSGSVFGTFNIGGDEQARLAAPGQTSGAPSGGTDVGVSISLPELLVEGAMKPGNVIPLTKAFEYFFKNPGPQTTSGKIANITALGFSADPVGQVFHAGADIVFATAQGGPAAPGWDIDLVVMTVSLEELSFWIDVVAGKVGGGIAGVFALDQGGDAADDTRPRVLLRAEYPIQDPAHATGWRFGGYLYPGTTINLTAVVARFLGLGSTPAVPPLTVDRLAFEFSTGDKSYTLAGTISARWTPEIFNTRLSISAAASIDIARAGAEGAGAAGTLSGKFAINKIAVEAAMDVGVAERTYQFKVLFGELWFAAVTSWRGEAGNRRQAISLQLGGTTLGEILEYLVNLAAPTLGFRLDPPWNVLKQIELSRFVLTLDPKENVVEFVFKADVDLTVARIASVGVRYTRGGSGKVDLILEGSFLGKKYEGDKALKWDVVNDPPPAVPGQGQELIDLRYIGIGQRIRLQDPPDTVRETLALLRKLMKPVDDPKKLPGAAGPLAFAADSQWLVGLDIGLMGSAVDLGIIFNDPVLYGLSIGLNGEKVGSLAGLRFEILYKKITDTTGMFRAELRVPDAFRTFQVGVASFTLGVVVVEIYTNGNFMIDLGFPHNRNFERSFSVQAYFFIGRGGVYFGVLNGATSRRIPRITNGNFSPVLELGVGLAAGVGREIRAGILAGGAYVQVEVIFQGVLGWFNPDSKSAAPARYFWAQGVAAIHGKVYGYVDFKVIKVSISLEAYAQASVIFECYRPTVFRLEVSVSAEAEIEILFFTVSFSFDVALDLEFKLGNVEPTPWILAPDQPGSGQRRLLAGRGRRDGARMRDALARHHLQQVARLRHALYARGAAQEEWGWNPNRKLWPDALPRRAHLTLVPAFSVGAVPLSWTLAPDGAPAPSAPDYRAAFVLCADSGVSATARTAAATRVRSAALNPLSRSADDTDALTSDLWAQMFLLYSLYSIPGGPAGENDPVTAGQLALLIKQLDDPKSADEGFALGMLTTIFKNNLHLVISAPPTGTPAQAGGMIAPLPPCLAWTSPQAGNIDFSRFNSVGPWYEWGIAELMGQYFPVGGARGARPGEDKPDQYESFAACLFRDYCLMIARAAAKEAQGVMHDVKVVVKQDAKGDTPSLNTLAGGFAAAPVDYAVRAGDTVASVAEAVGATASEVAFLNPDLADDLASAPAGATLSIALGIAPEVLAQENAGQAFLPTRLSLGTVAHQVARKETLSAIADLFHVADPATLFQHDTSEAGLGASPGLLRAGALVDYPGRTWRTASGQDRLRAAATFFARYALPGLDQSGWYAQAIFDLNPDKMKALFPDQRILRDLELPPGQSLLVPAQFNRREQTTGYVTVAGDTLLRIGLALTLEQVYPATSPAGATGWQDYLQRVTAPAPGTFAIPAWPALETQPGEDMEALCRRLIVDAAWSGTDPGNPAAGSWSYRWSDVVQWAGLAQMLEPLAVVPVPGATAVAVDGASLSFTVLAQRYGMAIPDAARRLQDTANLYPDCTTLAVAAVPVASVRQLLDGVSAGESLARIVNQASRSLVAGLRLPAPVPDADGHVVPSATTTLPLYDITGQQFGVAVSSDPAKADEVALEVTVTSLVDWVTFAAATAARPDDTYGALLGRHPLLAQHSPGMAAAQRAHPGMLVLTAALDRLDYSCTNAQILAQSPATALNVPLPELPSALALRGEVPRTYGLDHRIELQSALPIPIPGAVIPALSAQPSLWPFNADLLARAEAGVADSYELLAVRQGGPAARHGGGVGTSTWACLIPFKLRRVDGDLTRFTLVGIDAAERKRVRALIDWLPADKDRKTSVVLLAASAPNAGNAEGLCALPANAVDTFLVKTNLSTATVPAFAASAAATTSEYSAPLSDLGPFLKLLWEGSVVGGAGYYLGVKPALAAGLVDDEGVVALSLLVVAATQQDPAPEGRALLKFNNCALVGPALDASASTLFVESYGDTDMVAQALVPPGSVGFRLRIDRPDESGDKEQKLRRLYSLLSFSAPARAGGTYAVPASGMPVPPEPAVVASQPLWQRERLRRRKLLQDDRGTPVPKPRWKYEQTVPVSRFGPASVLPEVTGLPAAELDPYRGFGTAGTLPSVDIELGFGDIFGNRTAAGGGQGVSIVVGYTDPLIGIAEWPDVACAYQVEGAAGHAQLAVTIAPRPSALVPSPAQDGTAAPQAAAEQAKKYAASYYQLGQDVRASLLTTLKADPAPGALDIDMDELRRFAAAAYVHASAVASMRAARAPGGSNLAGLCTAHNVRYAEMALANAGQPVGQLFGNRPLTVPAFVPFALHASAGSIAAAPREGWPAPSSVAILADANNGKLPLRPGAVLSIHPVTISTGDTPGKLAEFCKRNGTMPRLLAADNDKVAMLQPGYVFSAEVAPDTYVHVVTSGTPGEAVDTLDKVAAAFVLQGVNLTPADLAESNAGNDGLLAANVPLISKWWVAADDETLADNGSHQGQQALAELNVATPDLFDEGAAIYLGTFGAGGGVLPAPEQSLREFADSYGCPVEQLLQANDSVALPGDTTFAIPGLFAWPADPAPISVPYSVRATDTLDGVAGRFAFAQGDASAATQLASRNAAMPRVLAGGLAIDVNSGGRVVRITTPPGGTSFAGALAQVRQVAPDASMEELAAAIGPMERALRPGVLLLCPPCKLAANAAPQDLAALYTVDAAQFVLANAATPGLIAAGQQLAAPDGTTVLRTLPGDTINSLIVRFGEHGVHVDAADIANAEPNLAVPFIQGGCLALLPPAPARFEKDIAASAYPGPLFPLAVKLRLERPAALVHPEFDPSGPVRAVESAIPAAVHDHGAAGERSLTVDAFVQSLEQALPGLRVATAKAEGNGQDLWAVDFGQAGIRELTVKGGTTVRGQSNPQPRYFALTPLYATLVARKEVPIKSLTGEGTLSPNATDTQFQGIDAEVWATRVLADIDRFFGAANAARWYRDPATRTSLDSVMRAKAALVKKIARGLGAILDIADPLADAGLTKAQDALEQQLGAGLGNAYATSSIVQFDRVADSPWQRPDSGLSPANLYGQLAPLAGTPDDPMRGWSATAAKTALDDSNPFVTFLVSVSDPALHRNVSAKLEYDISHLEHNIADAGDGYKSSSWLGFVTPLAGVQRPDTLRTDLGRVMIPIPLRNFPTLPIIAGQAATATEKVPTTVLRQLRARGPRIEGVVPLQRMALWDYAFSYSHQHAEQDEVTITAQFNLRQQLRTDSVVAPVDLFTEMAKYIAVADSLWGLLDAPPAGAALAATSATPLQNAVQTFAQLIGNIATNWSVRLAPAPVDEVLGGVGLEVFAYRARVAYDADGNVACLTLTSTGAGIGPNGIWPAVSCRLPDGTQTELEAELEKPTVMRYKVGEGVAVPAGWPTFTLRWSELNVAQWQNAAAHVNVQRNQRLLGDDGPNTSEAFLFKTDEVYATGVATPILTWSERVQISGTPGADYVKTALNNAFAALFPSVFEPGAASIRIGVGISFAHELLPDPIDPSHSLVSEVPIALYPDKQLDSATAGVLQDACYSWKRLNQPNQKGGEWVFSITAYSSMAGQMQPLLVIERLFCRMDSSMN